MPTYGDGCRERDPASGDKVWLDILSILGMGYKVAQRFNLWPYPPPPLGTVLYTHSPRWRSMWVSLGPLCATRTSQGVARVLSLPNSDRYDAIPPPPSPPLDNSEHVVALLQMAGVSAPIFNLV